MGPRCGFYTRCTNSPAQYQDQVHPRSYLKRYPYTFWDLNLRIQRLGIALIPGEWCRKAWQGADGMCQLFKLRLQVTKVWDHKVCTNLTMYSSLSSLSRLISRIAVLGTPSSSASSRIFFRATIRPFAPGVKSFALYTTPYVPAWMKYTDSQQESVHLFTLLWHAYLLQFFLSFDNFPYSLAM